MNKESVQTILENVGYAETTNDMVQVTYQKALKTSAKADKSIGFLKRTTSLMKKYKSWETAASAYGIPVAGAGLPESQTHIDLSPETSGCFINQSYKDGTNSLFVRLYANDSAPDVEYFKIDFNTGFETRISKDDMLKLVTEDGKPIVLKSNFQTTGQFSPVRNFKLENIVKMVPIKIS